MPPIQVQEESENSINFKDIESKVFTEVKGKIYIGQEEIKPELLEVLKEQARYLSTSQLYDILNATIVNETSNLALIQSKDFDQVRFAKALHHWNFVLRNMVSRLTK